VSVNPPQENTFDAAPRTAEHPRSPSIHPIWSEVFMKRHLRHVLAATAAAALGLAAPLAMSQDSVPVEAAEGGTLWFVELAGAPVADGNTLGAVQAEKAAFRRNAAIAGVRFTERRSYDVLFNGFAVQVELRDRARLSQIAGVKAIYPVETIAAPSPEVAAGSALDMAAAVALTGANTAQNARGLTGRGIKVGIVDTGIDIDHPAFGGGGVAGSTAFPSARVVSGWDFVGDAYNSSGTGAALTPVPDANPDDCNGHGTHVAGIVGANGGGIKGVAPGVSFGAYRVFGCTGTTSSDIIVAALERAYADGMQVINQSLGAARQWPQYPTAQASSRLVSKGVVMVASIGNNGPGGSSPDALFAAGAPGVGAKVIGVASFDNAQRAFTVNGTAYGYNPATASPLPPTSGSLPMGRTWTGAAPSPATSTTAAPVNDGCAALPAGSMTGLAVLIRRGTCGFHVKALNAQNAGAAAVVLYNNQAGAINATVAGTPAITIPVVGITAAQGVTLHNAIAAGPTTLTWTGDYVGFPFGTGGLISGFSSFGLAADLALKPNIGAPGGGIFSSYPLEQGGTATLSGTSMSSPHVAGGVALILEARPNLKAAAMQAWLQGSAKPKAWSGNAALGLLDHTFRQGAGMLDIVGTIDATTVVEPSQISVGESAAGPKTTTLTLSNQGSSAVTYALSHVAGVAAGPNTQTGATYNLTGVFDAPAAVTFSAASITVPANGSASVDVTVAANATLPDRSLYGGYVVMTPQGAGATYRVPFAGFKGDYQATQVLTPTANGFPWLAQQVGTSLFNRNATGATYTMVGNDIPQVLMHLDHLSRRIRLEAFDAITGKAWHRVSDDEYVTRNSTPGGFFTFAWDGTTFTGKGKNASQQYTVPNGQYIVKVSVLKALGDEDNPAHWETFTTNTITIARP
jgi:minor extracellular serine protease Vpr